MILVDANVPMYLVGGPHRYKTDAQQAVESCITADERLVTDAEVLQEILHRFVALDRRQAIQPAFDALLRIVDEVFPVTRQDTERAKEIVLGSRKLSARDAIHLAVMDRHGVDTILSFDRGFDAYPGITRRGDAGS